MEHVSCNLCGSTALRPVYTMPDAKFFNDQWFTVVECVGCGLGFLNPRPTREEMGKHYPAEYYDYLSPAGDQLRYERQAEFLAERKRAAERPRLLDVGCANGDFPRFMMRSRMGRGRRRSVVHVDADPDFPVHPLEFSRPTSIPDASFDAVTAWAVLEHVHDPMAYFRKASAVLKPERPVHSSS